MAQRAQHRQVRRIELQPRLQEPPRVRRAMLGQRELRERDPAATIAWRNRKRGGEIRSRQLRVAGVAVQRAAQVQRRRMRGLLSQHVAVRHRCRVEAAFAMGADRLFERGLQRIGAGIAERGASHGGECLRKDGVPAPRARSPRDRPPAASRDAAHPRSTGRGAPAGRRAADPSASRFRTGRSAHRGPPRPVRALIRRPARPAFERPALPPAKSRRAGRPCTDPRRRCRLTARRAPTYAATRRAAARGGRRARRKLPSRRTHRR